MILCKLVQSTPRAHSLQTSNITQDKPLAFHYTELLTGVQKKNDKYKYKSYLGEIPLKNTTVVNIQSQVFEAHLHVDTR